MNSELNFWSLISQANIVVQLIMFALLLMLVSVIFLSWKKWMLLKFAERDIKKFEVKFWSGGDMNELYQKSSQEKYRTDLEYIFLAGLQEFNRLRSNLIYSPEFVVENVTRAMSASAQKEERVHRKTLSWLATMGSVSPYFGLFGTVIGVMNSFIALGSVKQVTLAQVAPGIAEALIATAMGLLVAIPAVMLYNHFINKIDKIVDSYDIFIEEFANILARQYAVLKSQSDKGH